MTLEAVQAAKVALEREGKTPSLNAILAHIGHGSKRDVAAFMKQLNGLETAAVAVEDPMEPELSPDSPLGQARQRRDETAAAELALALEEQALQGQRDALDDARQQCDIQQQTVRTDAADQERRRQRREALTQLETVEAERRAVHRRRQAAAAAMVAAQDAYDALQGQAGRWLRRLREAQRVVQTSPAAFERGDAREEFEQALGELAALVGRAEAQAVADDPALQPAWLRG